MEQLIRRFSVIQTAKVFGVLNAILLLLQVPGFSGKDFPKDFPFKFSPLLLLIAVGIAGFVIPAVACVVYNWVAGKVGGIKLRFDGERIGRVSVAQTAKVLGIMYGLLGILLGITFVLVFRSAAMPFFPKEDHFPGVGFVLGAPIFYGVFGFIVTAIGCALYNLAARMVGGVELHLENKTTGQRLRRFSIFQTAKVSAVFHGMISLLFAPVFWVIAHAAPKQAGFAAGFALLFPILFAVGGFIFAAFLCATYNGLARVLGGIEMQFEGEAMVA